MNPSNLPVMPSLEQQRNWVAVAESLKPSLHSIRCDPVGQVKVVADPTAFQGLAVQPAGDLAELSTRKLRRGDAFTLDFGTHCVGYLTLDLDRHGSGDSPTRLRLTFGETPAEVIEPFEPYAGKLSRAWLQDEVVNIDFVPATVRLPRRYAFRYLKVEVIDTSGAFSISVKNVWCDTVSSAAPLDTEGLQTGDTELGAIEKVSLLTLRQCMQTVFEDGPKRDRRLWIGDLRLQALANSVSFRNFDLVKRCLYLHAGLLREDGMVPACVYETPEPRIGGNFIVDYSAFFAPTLLEYAHHSGDTAAANDLWPVALWQTECLKKYFDTNGRFCNPDRAWVFIDWNPDIHKDAAATGALLYGLRKTIQLAELIHREDEVTDLRQRFERLRAVAIDKLFDKALGVFTSGPDRQVSWLSQAWMILGGVIEGDPARRALRNAAADSTATKPAGPYGWHYVIEAMTACGMKAEAMKILSDYWGKTIHLGADTFWEVFDPADEKLSPYNTHLLNSYCHAWSCTPVYFLRTDFAPPR